MDKNEFMNAEPDTTTKLAQLRKQLKGKVLQQKNGGTLEKNREMETNLSESAKKGQDETQKTYDEVGGTGAIKAKAFDIAKKTYDGAKKTYNAAGGTDAIKTKVLNVAKNTYDGAKKTYDEAGGTDAIKAKTQEAFRNIKTNMHNGNTDEPIMKFNWGNWNFGGKIIFISACASIVSMFMKWVDVGFIAQSGLSQQAFLLLILYIYPVVMLFKNKSINLFWGLTCSICACISVLFYIDSKSIDLLGNSINAASTGAYLFLLTSISLTVGIVKYNPRITANNS